MIMYSTIDKTFRHCPVATQSCFFRRVYSYIKNQGRRSGSGKKKQRNSPCPTFICVKNYIYTSKSRLVILNAKGKKCPAHTVNEFELYDSP